MKTILNLSMALLSIVALYAIFYEGIDHIGIAILLVILFVINLMFSGNGLLKEPDFITKNNPLNKVIHSLDEIKTGHKLDEQ